MLNLSSKDQIVDIGGGYPKFIMFLELKLCNVV